MNPIMPIPRHTPCRADEMAGLIEGALSSPCPNDYLYFNLSSPALPLAGERLTRVPFLKLCLNGSFRVIPEKGAEAKIVGPGTFVLFAPNSFANVQYSEACDLLRITFDADGMLIGRESIGTTLRKGAPDTPAGTLRAIWLQGPLSTPSGQLLRNLLDQGSAGSLWRSIDFVRTLFWEITAQLRLTEKKPVPNSGNIRNDQTLRFIQDQCQRPVTRESVAAALGVSPGHLGRIVKRSTGKSFTRVVSEARLDQARWLLKNSNLSIEEVALRCGFSSANYFAQAFKRDHGQSPLAWRLDSSIEESNNFA